MESFGNVRTYAFKSEMSFKCVAHPNGEPVVAYVHLRVRKGLRVLIHRQHLSDDLLADGFTRACNGGRYREIAIRDGEHIRKAEPLLRAAYDSVGKPQEHGETPGSVAARKAWATRRARRGTENAESSLSASGCGSRGGGPPSSYGALSRCSAAALALRPWR